MVETRSSSKSDSRVTPTTKTKTKKRKKTAVETPKKVNTENARTPPKLNPITEHDRVKEYYALWCAKQYREANEGRHPKLKFLMEKQAEFLELDKKKQLEITAEYRAESKKNKNEETDEEDSDEEETDEEIRSRPELAFAQVYYAVQYRKKYMADNGGKKPPIEVLDAKQSEFRCLTDEEKEKIIKEYLADKEKRKREREEFERHTFGMSTGRTRRTRTLTRV